MISEYKPQIWKKQDTILVKLSYSDLDNITGEHFKLMVSTLINNYKCRCLILDLSNIILVDGSGFAALISIHRSCEEKDIKMLLAGLKENLIRSMEDKGLNIMFETFKTVHDALDTATYYSTITVRYQKNLKDIEKVFGDPFEENISY